MATFVYLENGDREGRALVGDLGLLPGTFIIRNPRYFVQPEGAALVYVRRYFTELIDAYRAHDVPVVVLEDIGERQPPVVPDTPVEAGSASATRFTMQPRGEGFGWWDVVDNDGVVHNRTALRRDDAEALVTSLEQNT